MKGYFSQLAQHTGLSFDAARGAQAKKAARPSAISAEVERSVLAPLDVEAIVLAPSVSAPHPDASEVTHQDQAPSRVPDSLAPDGPGKGSADAEAGSRGKTLEAAASHNEGQPAPGTFVESRGSLRDSKPAAETVQEHHSANQYQIAGPSLPGVFHDPSDGPRSSLDRIEVVKTHSAVARIPAQRNETQAARPDDNREPRGWVAGREQSELLDRELSVGDYLKEVMAWVSATPEIDVQQPEPSRSRDMEELSEKVFALDQRDQHSLTPSDTREPEVHDLNLSIGSISIVIEEPKAAAPPASLAPPPRSERSSERSTSEPTNLSRYYLRSW